MNPEEINKIIEEASTGNYVPHGDISNADCLIGFSFGYREKNGEIFPGLSNEDMANMINEKFFDLPKILQFEIADALDGKNIIERITVHRNADQYLNSQEVAEQALNIMRQNNWSNAILIAHPHHIPRVNAICKKLGITTIVPIGLENIRFDPQSAQPWTRDVNSWIQKEGPSIRRHAKQNRI